MLKPYFQNRKTGPPVNMENLFVHRVEGLDNPPEMRSRTPNTFWRSPYNGDTGSSTTGRAMCLRPMLTISGPLTKAGDRSDSGLQVKSILKHTTADESDGDLPKTEVKLPRPSSEVATPRFITTGTGQGRPHGTQPRAKTAGKRVQFTAETMQGNRTDLTRSPMNLQNLNSTKVIPFKGRRLYLDKTTSTRILGSSAKSSSTSKWHSRRDSSGSLGSGEANIKSQINAFIRKLKLAECERAAKLYNSSNNSITIIDETTQRKSADKIRRLRTCPAVPSGADWGEHDIDRLPETKQSVSSLADSNTKTLTENNENGDSVSESVSIESFENSKKEKVVEETPGGARIFRPRPNASLYTKYRHITTNEFNKYGTISTATKTKPRLPSVSAKGARNYCDTRKTDQILGWLQEVNSSSLVGEGVDKPVNS